MIRLNPKCADPRFILYYLQSVAGQSQISNSLNQGAQANLFLGPIGALQVPLPSLPEQVAIAAALSAMDGLLDALDRLIAKKHDLKQAAVQHLLTGQARLPGFSGKWEVRRVAERGEVLAGKALDVYGAGRLRPYLRTKNVLDGRIDIDDVLEMPMTDAEFDHFRVVRGDVLLNEGQSLELVGRSSLYRDELPVPCAMQNQLLRFRARPATSPSFAEQLFRRCQHNGVFSSIATQTTSVAHLGCSRFSKLRLLWPIDLEEQEAIGSALADMDAEVAALEQRRDKTRLLKQGMMQELLTGRTCLL
jgi:type I restriction enzyme S subunit